MIYRKIIVPLDYSKIKLRIKICWRFLL